MKNIIYDTKIFIEKAKKIHPEYDYSKTIYNGHNVKILVICPIHGEFSVNTSSHLRGTKCRKCQTNKVFNEFSRKYTEGFLERANKVHNFKYFYPDFPKIICARDFIDIICPTHGLFKQQSSKHLCGNGCKKCGFYRTLSKRIDYNLNELGVFYILKFEGNSEIFYKVGISKKFNKRLRDLQTYYSVTVLHTEENYLKEIIEREYEFLNSFQNYKYKPKKKFGGYTECLSVNPIDFHYYYNYETKLD